MHDASSTCARRARTRNGILTSDPDPEPSPIACTSPAARAGPQRRPRLPRAALMVVIPGKLSVVVGLGLGPGSGTPTSRETRAAAQNCCSGCSCWRARLNQGRLLTRRPCRQASTVTVSQHRACKQGHKHSCPGCPAQPYVLHPCKTPAQEPDITQAGECFIWRTSRYMPAPAPWSKLLAKGRLAASGRGGRHADPSAAHSCSAVRCQEAPAGAFSATQPGAKSATESPAPGQAACQRPCP